MQCHALPCNTIQYNAIPCNTVQYHAIPCNTMQYNAIPCKTMQYYAKPCTTIQYHAIPCNTMQYSAIPCNTMQYHAIPCIINNCWRSVPLPCGQYNGHFCFLQLQKLISIRPGGHWAGPGDSDSHCCSVHGNQGWTILDIFLATILNISWRRHTSSWTQRSFISQMATLWKSCSRYKRILLTPFLDGKLLQKTQVTSVLYSAMKSNSASGEGSEVSSIGVTYFENNAKDKMRFCWVFYFVQISLSP